LAKDVAALANTVGGSIIVGAATQGQRLIGYPGIPEQLVKAAGENYEKAAAQRCRPGPILKTQPLRTSSGCMVLVVNVWMSPVAPVGVNIRQKRAPLTDDAWAFPHRVGSQTAFFTPDQLGAVENMTGRRTAALLLGIPKGEWNQVRVSVIQAASPPNLRLSGRLEAVSLGENVAQFAVCPPGGKFLPLQVPLDWILTVWRDALHNKWEVVLDARVFAQREDDRWVVHPRAVT